MMLLSATSEVYKPLEWQLSGIRNAGEVRGRRASTSMRRQDKLYTDLHDPLTTRIHPKGKLYAERLEVAL